VQAKEDFLATRVYIKDLLNLHSKQSELEGRVVEFAESKLAVQRVKKPAIERLKTEVENLYSKIKGGFDSNKNLIKADFSGSFYTKYNAEKLSLDRALSTFLKLAVEHLDASVVSDIEVIRTAVVVSVIAEESKDGSALEVAHSASSSASDLSTIEPQQSVEARILRYIDVVRYARPSGPASAAAPELMPSEQEIMEAKKALSDFVTHNHDMQYAGLVEHVNVELGL